MHCRSTVIMRAAFILEFQEDIKKVQASGATDEDLRTLIEGIRKFMRGDSEDFETKQQVIGMKHLFRVFSIKAWKETDFSCDKHTVYNRIVNKHYMNYY